MRRVELEKINPLLAPPTLLPKLLEAVANPSVDLEDVAKLIKLEPALVARLLRLCNSAYFASARATADVAEALQRVGLEVLYQLVASLTAERCLSTVEADCGFNVRGLWKHSVLAGFGAEMLAGAYSLDRSVFFTAGLLHDFGKLIFASAHKGSYGEMMLAATDNPSTLIQLERDRFEVDHAELGSHLLLKWGFPDDIMWSVRYHHSPAGKGNLADKAALVTVADSLAHVVAFPNGRSSTFEIAGESDAFKTLGISEDLSRSLVNRLRAKSNMIDAIVGAA
jgi:putative nucleotidyltransferase with HDIG domain